MKVKDLMTTAVEVCGPDDALSRVAEIMRDHDCGSVPVVDESREVVGILTHRDVCMAAYAQGLPLQAIPAKSAMTDDVKFCRPEDEAETAVEIMDMGHFHRVPVVNTQNQIQGIISLGDVAHAPKHSWRLGSEKPSVRRQKTKPLAGSWTHAVEKSAADDADDFCVNRLLPIVPGVNEVDLWRK